MQIGHLAIPFVSLLLTLVVAWISPGTVRRRNLLLLGLMVFTVFGLSACGANAVQSLELMIVTASGIIPLLGAAGSAIDPAESGPINSAAGGLVASLQTLLKLIKGYQGNPNDSTLQKVQAGFNDVQRNLSAVESAAHVKDPNSQKKLTSIVAGIGVGLATVEAAVLATHPQTVQNAQSGT